MLESLPKQVADKPEFMALIGTVRTSMVELFTMANALPETVTHDISSDAGFNGQGMDDVTADGNDDGVDSVELACMVDELVGESLIDRDGAVMRLGALLQRQSKRPRVHWKQATENSETSG